MLVFCSVSLLSGLLLFNAEIGINRLYLFSNSLDKIETPDVNKNYSQRFGKIEFAVGFILPYLGFD